MQVNLPGNTVRFFSSVVGYMLMNKVIFFGEFFGGFRDFFERE
jgi:hypothetical protein